MRQGWRYGVVGLIVGLVGLGVPQGLPRILAYGVTPSLPKGWYVRQWSQRPLQVGDIVVVRTPAILATRMPPNVPGSRLLKMIAGVPGMYVCWTTEAMTVEGRVYPRHAAIQDAAARVGCGIVDDGEVLLVGLHPRSFDSRYFGPVPLHLVQWRAQALWTWETQE